MMIPCDLAGATHWHEITRAATKPIQRPRFVHIVVPPGGFFPRAAKPGCGIPGQCETGRAASPFGLVIARKLLIVRCPLRRFGRGIGRLYSL